MCGSSTSVYVARAFKEYAVNIQMLYVYTLVVKWEARDRRFRSPCLLYFRFSMQRSSYRTIPLFGPPDMMRLLLLVALKAYINWLSTHCQHSLGFWFAFLGCTSSNPPPFIPFLGRELSVQLYSLLFYVFLQSKIWDIQCITLHAFTGARREERRGWPRWRPRRRWSS